MSVKDKSKLGEKAVEHFREGYNCAQSVLLTMFEHWGCKNDLVPKVATGFGGGIGRCGSVCGALTGGVLALSIRYGTNGASVEERIRAYEVVQEFYRRFEKQNGSVLCRELIGYDLSDPKQLDEAHKANVSEEKCDAFVRKAVETLVEITQT